MSNQVSHAGYEETLSSTLSTTIKAARSRIGALPDEPVRVIVHAKGTANNRRYKALRRMLSTLGDGVEVTLLHVSQEHPFVLFDRKQRGVQPHGSLSKHGAFAPARGSFLTLSERESLLCLSGAKEIESWRETMPRPLLLKLDSCSSFQDMNSLVQHMFAFSAHSGQSFSPVTLPVTLFYTELIKRKLPQLMAALDWHADLLLGRSHRCPWFL